MQSLCNYLYYLFILNPTYLLQLILLRTFHHLIQDEFINKQVLENDNCRINKQHAHHYIYFFIIFCK